MDDKILKIIDETVKYIWENDIKADYKYGWLLKEDTLKNSFYYYLRAKLENLFCENDIRIFTEFTDNKFKGSHKRPDIVIAKVNLDGDSKYYGDDIIECLAVIELKYKTGLNPSNDIYKDYEKLKTYVTELDVKCPLYMATIWEYEDEATLWARKNAAWAKDRLTELNASYDPKSKEMRFYIGEHKKSKRGKKYD